MSKLVQHPPRTLSAEHLASTRGERLIFDHLSFSVSSGKALLLRGANGSGKTTLLNILAGALGATDGSFAVSGRNDDEERPGSDMHFVGHLPAIKPSLTLTENLEFWLRVNGGKTQAIAPALQNAGLGTLADLDAAILSAGQTKRLALCRLAISPRPIWLLDEPTSALDAEGDIWVADLVDRHLAQGGLAIIATHRDIALGDPTRVTTLTIGGKAQ